MALKIVTEPAAEPISTQEAKDHCRIDDSTDDTLVSALITAARSLAEQFTRRAIITQTWDLWLDGVGSGFPSESEIIVDSSSGYAYTGANTPAAYIEIPLSPLASVTAVYYYQDNDTQQTWGATNYIVDAKSEPGRVILKTGGAWPQSLRPGNGIQVRFVAGYGSTGTSVPGPIKQAILQTIGHLYENRESQTMPGLAQMLLQPYRILRL